MYEADTTIRSHGASAWSPELWRIAVTLGALAVYWFGASVPAPLFDPGYLQSLGAGGNGTDVLVRMSLLSLGIEPMFTVLLAAEVLKLASPGLMGWLRADSRHVPRFNGYVVAAALCLAALQAWPMALAFEQVQPSPVTEPGGVFRLEFVLIAVAGTALSIWLADQITRHGVGSGVWLLLLAPYVNNIPETLATITKQLAANQIELAPVQALAVFVPVAIAIIAAIEKARRHLTATDDDAGSALAEGALRLNYASLWPPLIAVYFATQAYSASIAVFGARGEASIGPHWFQPGSVSSLVLIVALIFLLTYMQTAAAFAPTKRDGRADGIVSRLAFLTAAAYALICVVLEVLRTRYALPIMDGGRFIAIVLVGLSILPASLSAFLPDRPREPQREQANGEDA